MTLNELELDRFTLAILNTYDLSRLNISKCRAKREIREELAEDLEDLNNPETLEARHANFQVPKTSASDYKEKLHKIDDNRAFIYGIRNLGANPDLPFVNIIPNFEVSTKAEVMKLYECVKNEFSSFSPLYACIHTRQEVQADLKGSIHMVSKLETIVNKTPWDEESNLKLVQVTDDSYYQWYKDGYNEFHKESPELSSKVQTNGIDIMQESLEEELLYYARIGGKNIGLIAAIKSEFLGHSGVYFNEIFLTKDYKGRGLAKAIQRKFLAEYCSELDYVWGTIDAENLPSLKTAKSNGRIGVRFENYFKI